MRSPRPRFPRADRVHDSFDLGDLTEVSPLPQESRCDHPSSSFEAIPDPACPGAHLRSSIRFRLRTDRRPISWCEREWCGPESESDLCDPEDMHDDDKYVTSLG